MEFNFPLDEIFPAQISIVDEKLVPRNSPGIEKLGLSVVKARTIQILEAMGKASAEAQNLKSIITSAKALSSGASGPNQQVVYFHVDFTANQVVGLLKMGRKKLFVYDLAGVLHELSPMCVLDFYIHGREDVGRRFGGAKALFETMLGNEGISRIEHLAMDRPSDELNDFFRKEYGLKNLIPQVNNFAVFDGFFDGRTDYAGKKPRWAGLEQPSGRTFHPHAHDEAATATRLQDSGSYNTAPALHLRTDAKNTRGASNSTFEFGNAGPAAPGAPGTNGKETQRSMFD